MPDWYLDEPPLRPMDAFYLRAFRDLNSCRSFGMEAGPIPWVAIRMYADDSRLDDEIIPAFVEIIQCLDRVYLDWIDQNRQKADQRIGNRVVER